MADKTITLRADLVDRLEELARAQQRSIDEVFADLLMQYAPTASSWAANIAQTMENADIDWQDMPDLSANSRASYEDHLRRKAESDMDDDHG